MVDSGDADVEVHSGDWAILKVTEPIELPALKLDTEFAYEFAEPIFRLGNDYSKGIIVSTGYVGQRTGNGLVTCLTDGHPGVSGGGVLDRDGDLVGHPDRQDAGRLPVLVHPARAARDVPQGAGTADCNPLTIRAACGLHHEGGHRRGGQKVADPAPEP